MAPALSIFRSRNMTIKDVARGGCQTYRPSPPLSRVRYDGERGTAVHPETREPSRAPRSAEPRVVPQPPRTQPHWPEAHGSTHADHPRCGQGTFLWPLDRPRRVGRRPRPRALPRRPPGRPRRSDASSAEVIKEILAGVAVKGCTMAPVRDRLHPPHPRSGSTRIGLQFVLMDPNGRGRRLRRWIPGWTARRGAQRLVEHPVSSSGAGASASSSSPMTYRLHVTGIRGTSTPPP